MIEPLFEKLAYNRSRAAGVGGGGGVAFVKVDLGVGSSGGVAQEYSVRATPTFIFFLDGKKACIQASEISCAHLISFRITNSRGQIKRS